MESGKEGRVLEQTPVYKWAARGGTVLILVLCLFMIKAGLDGQFNSVETLHSNILRDLDYLHLSYWYLIQAFQVVVPVLPGFLGRIVQERCCLERWEGFWCNYIGICAGSIIAFALAQCYGAPLVKRLFPEKQYETWINRLQNKRSYTCFFSCAFCFRWRQMISCVIFPGSSRCLSRNMYLLFCLPSHGVFLFYSLGVGVLIN